MDLHDPVHQKRLEEEIKSKRLIVGGAKMRLMTAEERAVLRLIPISNTRRINCADIMRITKLSARSVKQIIHDLVNVFEIIIIGERTGNTGYHIPETDEARRDGIKPMRAQALKELKRVNRILKGDLKKHEEYLKEDYND